MQVGAPCGTTHVHLMPCACQQQAYPAAVGKTWKSQQTNQRPPLHQNRQWLSHPSVPPLGLYFVMVIYCCWYLLCKCVTVFFCLVYSSSTSSAGVIWRQCGQVAPPSLTPPLTTYQWGQADRWLSRTFRKQTLIAGSPLLCQEVFFFFTSPDGFHAFAQTASVFMQCQEVVLCNPGAQEWCIYILWLITE